MAYDLIIANGTVVGASGTQRADVAVRGERIAAVGTDLGDAKRTLDATLHGQRLESRHRRPPRSTTKGPRDRNSW